MGTKKCSLFQDDSRGGFVSLVGLGFEVALSRGSRVPAAVPMGTKNVRCSRTIHAAASSRWWAWVSRPLCRAEAMYQVLCPWAQKMFAAPGGFTRRLRHAGGSGLPDALSCGSSVPVAVPMGTKFRPPQSLFWRGPSGSFIAQIFFMRVALIIAGAAPCECCTSCCAHGHKNWAVASWRETIRFLIHPNDLGILMGKV